MCDKKKSNNPRELNKRPLLQIFGGCKPGARVTNSALAKSRVAFHGSMVISGQDVILTLISKIWQTFVSHGRLASKIILFFSESRL